MNFALLLPALLAGMLIPVQGVVNAQLARHVGHPMSATLISVSVTFVSALIIFAAIRPSLPEAGRMAAVPWHLWVTGGLIGAYALFMLLFLAPRLGATTLMATLIAGQLLASVAIDRQGWFGMAERELSLGRIAGLVLLVAGVVLIRRF